MRAKTADTFTNIYIHFLFSRNFIILYFVLVVKITWTFTQSQKRLLTLVSFHSARHDDDDAMHCALLLSCVRFFVTLWTVSFFRDGNKN